MKVVVRGLTLALAILLCGVAFAQHGTSGALGRVIQLAQPAASAPQGFLASEAGISVYVDIGHPIDIQVAKGLLQGVEAETESYVIGVLAMEDYSESQWPHVYANSAGWIIVYYSKNDPAAKIMPWKDYNGGALTTTLLEIALLRYVQNLSRGMGVPLDISGMQVSYFDFRYPTASKLLIVVDTVNDGRDSFSYLIPSGLWVHEASWTLFGNRYSQRLWVDGVELEYLGSGYSVGRLGVDYLTLEQTHWVTVEGYECWAGVAIVFIYG